MTKLLSRHYNMDTRPGGDPVQGDAPLLPSTVPLWSEYGNSPAQRADWLLYDKPLEYAQMVLEGRWSTTCRWGVTR